MRCHTCGSSIPTGRAECDTCGEVARKPARALDVRRPAAPATREAILACPRCDYRGEGLPYFSRGVHTAILVGATLFTLPYALGAGGFIYYTLRREHLVCPRCGHGWGRGGENAREKPESTDAVRIAARGSAEGLQRVWSYLFFALAVILIAAGVTSAEAMAVVIGALAGAGGVVLHRAANRSREARRDALLVALQAPVLKLAAERDGRLTVTDVAASLGWSMGRAEKILHSLDDGWRVNSEVTDEGVIVYEFREILLGGGSSESGG